MSLFLTDQEAAAFKKFRTEHPIGQDFYWALLNRVDARAAAPGYHGREEESEWWFTAAEFLSETAMAHALRPTETTGTWLRSAALAMVRRPVSDWVGPWFRNHRHDPPMGHLETGHLTWGLAVLLDLAGDVFNESERAEVESALRERGIPMCRRWMDQHNHLANWRTVLGAGIAAAAAVLNDREEIARAVADYQLSLHIFQPDGSYAESLQYGNYAAHSLMIAREALLRRDPSLATSLSASPWNLLPRWQAASLFYHKPLSRWGSEPRARSANFNDSAALFRPSGDLLLHIAAREKTIVPREAGLARWLFDKLHASLPTLAPHDGASFGFVNDWGFLTVPLLPAAVEAIAPEEAGLTELESFSCGDVLARDHWAGRTILAVHGGGDPLYGPGHLHGDLNSFILVHNRERLLVDPGHSCYRNLLHDVEGSTRTHNTCTFLLNHDDGLGPQGDKHGLEMLQQSRSARTRFDKETRLPGPPDDRGARRLIAERRGEITVIGSEASALYSSTITEFSRFWLLCGSHALFVVDHIRAARPVHTQWHWLFNNRDGKLEFKPLPPDRIVARRGQAGMKLFHLGGAVFAPPAHAYVHDAYHPLPGGTGEGQSDSGRLLTWRDAEPSTERTVVHAIAVDGYGSVAGWHLKMSESGVPQLESPNATARWSVEPDFENSEAPTITLREGVSQRSWILRKGPNAWEFKNV